MAASLESDDVMVNGAEVINEKDERYIDMNSVKAMLENYKSLGRPMKTSEDAGTLASTPQSSIHAQVNKSPATSPTRTDVNSSSRVAMPTESATNEPMYAVVNKHRAANVTSSVPRNVNTTSDPAPTSKHEVKTVSSNDVRVNDGNDGSKHYHQPSHVPRHSYEPLQFSVYDQLQQQSPTNDSERSIVPGTSSSSTQERDEPTYADVDPLSTYAVTSQDVESFVFVVQSMGSLPVSETDLAPSRCASTIADCITNLAGLPRARDNVKPVFNWPTNTDINLELIGNVLNLIATDSRMILNTQLLRRIRLWGTGREPDSRYFAYVSCDESVDGRPMPYMCHVFKSRHPGVHAAHIVSALRTMCQRRAAKKKIQQP